MFGRVALTIMTAAVAFGVQANDYPERTIKIVNAFGAGGISDIFLRPMIQKMTEWTGQPVIIENKPGASGAIAADQVAKSAPDGYTLLLISTTHAVNETLNPNRGYVLMRDFAPITSLFALPNVLVVHPSVPAKSVKELIQLSKTRRLTFASSGPGSPFHLAGELFNVLGGAQLVHVPYKASGQARTDVLAGHVDVMFDALTTMKPHVQAGKLVALATTGAQRAEGLPGLPTVAEAGVPGYESSGWTGLLAPARTPPAVISRLHADITKYMSLPETKSLLSQQGMDLIGKTPDAFAAMLRTEIEKWGKVVKEANLKFE
jgi:tripartite-type tricarboxylate transporter receptor subunit TctC